MSNNNNARFICNKPYDNREVKPNEVLVPMMVSDELINLMPDVDSSNIRTWHMGGRKFKVMFYPVPAEFKEVAMQQFNSQVNEFLGEHRDVRCLIPQSDGSYKVCPKKNGNNRPDCVHCPHRGEYQREDKGITSLDALMDVFEFDPSPATSETDPIVLKTAYEELLTYLADKPRYKGIVSMGFNISSEGGNLAVGDRKELVEQVMEKYGLNRSRAYGIVADVLEYVKKHLYE